jgi:hypothetical protein
MASEISITRRDTFLFVHIQGDPVAGKERLSLFARMLGEAADANLDIVVHEDTPGAQPLAAVEYIARANFLGTSDLKKRIAYLPPPGFSTNTCELIENAAWNHGKRVRLFSRVEDAIDWIEGREDDTA